MKPEARVDAPASTASTSDAPRPAPAVVAPGRTYAALNPATPKVETSNLPQVHVVMNRPKPRARVARRARPVTQQQATPQKPPPFFELFAWLFNIQPSANQELAQPQAAPVQRPQARSSFGSPTAPAFRTAAQP